MTNFRRVLISLLAATAFVAVVPMSAFGSPQQVIEDYEDDGEVQGCYSAEDFQLALAQLDPTDALYESAPEVIQLARARCAQDAATGEDDGGSGAGVWIGIIVAVGLVAVGAGVLSRRRGGGGDAGGGGTPLPAGGDTGDRGTDRGDHGDGGGFDGGGAGGDGG